MDHLMKKGGPHTKKDQETRRNQILKLSFEQGKSAVKIAEILKVNRNTVNDDIKILYRELEKEWKSYDKHSWLVKQLNRLDNQRSRLLEDIEEENDIQKKIKIEEMLYKLDTDLIDFIIKLMENKTAESAPADAPADATDEVQPNENELKNTVMYLINDHPWANPRNYSSDEILCGIVMFLKCDEKYARKIKAALLTNGLDLFEIKSSRIQIGFTLYYDLLRYAYARGYISMDEMLDINKKYSDDDYTEEEDDE